MSELNHYLSNHFLNAENFASLCEISVSELDQLIQNELVPAPSYVVTDSSTVRSYVFGEMGAPQSTPGQDYHPANAVWDARARPEIVPPGAGPAAKELRETFVSNFRTALDSLNRTTLRLHDSFMEDGSPIAVGIKARTDIVWEHFLQGTFGLCVANPVSEAAIAQKEIFQEKLGQLKDDKPWADYTPGEARCILELVDAFEGSSMPFSPVEYHLSSRKSLVDDVRAELGPE